MSHSFSFMRPPISILFIMSLGSILNNSLDMIMNLQNPLVLSVAETLETYTYRIGLEKMQYSFATAVGLFQNLVGLVFVVGANMVVRRIDDGANAIW